MKSSIVSDAIRLIIIAVVAAALLGATYVITAEPIAIADEAKNTAARQEVLPAAASFEQFDVSAFAEDPTYGIVKEAYYGLDASGQPVGATFKISTNGFSAGLIFTVGVNADGTVSGVAIVSHGETAGLGANATDPEFRAQYVGFTGDPGRVFTTKDDIASKGITALTGSTITTRAITNGVNTACNFYNENMAK